MLYKLVKIISWNCNSAKVRNEHIKMLLNEHKPQILMLQETRCKEIGAIDGYFIYHNAAINGRNGVAIISAMPIQEINRDNCGRLIHCSHNNINFICVYVPNGGSISSPVIDKLNFFNNLSSMYTSNNIVIGGDFNVLYRKNEYTVPHPYTLEEQEKLIEIERHMSYSTLHSPYITWWDYRNNDFRRNIGYGIDKIYNSKDLKLKPIEVLYSYRRLMQPSDHAPILTEIIV